MRASGATRTVSLPQDLLAEMGRLEGQWPAQMQGLRQSGQALAMAPQRVVKRSFAYWEKPPQYYISDGVRRSLAARESNISFVRALLKREGMPDQFTQVHLDQLHSPKASIDLGDARFRPTLTPNYTPIEIEPLGLPGQSQTVPLLDVEIH
jgi:hypothetical protein